VARRPSTTGPRRIGMPSTTTGPIMLPTTKELPFKKIPPRKQFLQRPPTGIASVLGGRGNRGNDGYIIGPTDIVYNYSDLPKLKAQVAANPALAAMLGDIISRLEAKDFDGTGDPLGNRQTERPIEMGGKSAGSTELKDMIAKYLATQPYNNAEYREDYDTNKDGQINLTDALYAGQFAAGLRDPETLQPIEQTPPRRPMDADRPIGPRPPSIEEKIEQVISGPSFPGRQTSKFPEQPMRIPEPVGPITDTKTMPSMPVAPVPSPMSVPPIAIEDPDIQKVVDALPKGTQRPVQPPVTVSPPAPSVFDPGPVSDGTMGGLGYGRYPLGTAGPEYVYDDEGNPIMEPPVFDVPPPIPTPTDPGPSVPVPSVPPLPINPPQREVNPWTPSDITTEKIAEWEANPPKMGDPGFADYSMWKFQKEWAMCPSPEEHIQLANNDWILAGELKVGDEVATSETPQKVTRVQRIEGVPRCEVFFEEGNSIVSSYTHPYFVEGKGFVEVMDLEKGDVIGDLVVDNKKSFSDGPVISLSVDKTETYMLRGGTEENPVPALSHNKSPMPHEPDIPPGSPDTPVTPPGTGGAPPGFIPPSGPATMALVEYWNPTTGETWSAPSGGWTAPPGWEVAPSQSFLPGEPGEPMVPTTPPPPVTPPVDPTVPPVDPTVPPVDPTVPPGPETTPVQGMTMEEMQKMIADMQAQQQEQAAARAAQEKEMSKQYMVYGDRTGYNPYQSGQYQSDPYGPSGVPNMGGITTIPVPGGYGIYNPVYGR